MPQTTALKPRKPLNTKALLLILVGACLLVYGNTLRNGYVLDDVAVVTRNSYVQQGVAGIPKLLHTPYLRGFKMPATDTAASNDLYRPLPLVTFAVEKSLFDSSAAVSHLVNVLVYAACVCLLFVFLRRLLGEERTMVAFVAALMFAVHPVHTEVVANVKSRDELLCFLFAFGSLVAYCRYAADGKVWLLAAGAILYFLSLLSKETSVSFVAIVPLVFFLYLNEDRKRSISITVSTVVACIVFLLLRHTVLSAYNADHNHIDFIDNPLVGAPGASQFATAVLVMGKYLKLLVVPYPLISDYTFNTIPLAGFGNVWVLLAIAAYVAMLAIAIYRSVKYKKDAIAFGLWFFLLTIALFSNLFVLVGSIMAERFLFFPSVGFCLVAAVLIGKLKGRETSLFSRIATIVAVISLVFAEMTIQRNSEWKDNITLFTTDLEKAPENARLWYSLGYEKAGIADEDKPHAADLMSEGIADIQHSLSIYPGYANAHYTLSNLFIKVQQFDSALVHAKAAAKLSPADATIISGLGYAYFVKGQYQQSIQMARQALVYDPRNAAIWNNIAICYLQLQRYDSSIIASREALALNSKNILSLQNIIQVYTKLSQPDSVSKYQLQLKDAAP